MDKKILIVDDEPFILTLLVQTLEAFEDEGVTLLKASNGEEALRLAQIEWRRPTQAISRREMEPTRQVIRSYNQALAEAKPYDRAAGQHALQSIWG